MTATYATPLELARFLNIEGKIPSLNVAGASRARENVGTGDNTTLLFYLDNPYVLADTYNLYYGSSESTAIASAFTETTDYSLDKDKGIITLTVTGRTKLALLNIYSDYSYIVFNNTENNGVSNTMLQEALDRAEDEIDEKTGTHFATGTDATPTYVQVTNEKHDGKGRYDRAYYLHNFPLPNVSTTLDGDVAASATTITVDSTSGFLSSGYITIGDDKVIYTGKTTDTFTGCTNVVSAHDDGDTVYNHAIEISTTDSGTSPTWQTLSVGDQYDIDYDTGRIHLYITDYDLTYYALQYPPILVPNRFRATYTYGYDSIPSDIKRLCLMIASKDLMHAIVRRGLINGMSVPNLEQIGIDDKWIEDTLLRYSSFQSFNT